MTLALARLTAAQQEELAALLTAHADADDALTAGLASEDEDGRFVRLGRLVLAQSRAADALAAFTRASRAEVEAAGGVRRGGATDGPP